MFEHSKNTTVIQTICMLRKSQSNVSTSVYDTSSLDFLVVMGKKYDQVHEFNLKQAVSGQ